MAVIDEKADVGRVQEHWLFRESFPYQYVSNYKLSATRRRFFDELTAPAESPPLGRNESNFGVAGCSFLLLYLAVLS